MIESIQFENFKALRNTLLPLSGCTVLVGPNGSRKSTVFQALKAVREGTQGIFPRVVHTGSASEKDVLVRVKLNWGQPFQDLAYVATWKANLPVEMQVRPTSGIRGDIPPTRLETASRAIKESISRFRFFSFSPQLIAAPATVQEKIDLQESGECLAAVLDAIRDTDQARFDAINAELARWLPEFDGIEFVRPSPGNKSLVLRTHGSQDRIPAAELSDGTLIALALLTLAYLPDPPSLVGIEEPDHGVHPRLMRQVRDALYRLADPASFGEKRAPVQVIATTHSPYFLDQFKDHPDQVVVANKTGLEVQFVRVSDQPDIGEILGGAPLGEVWYTGILGGVPAEP